MKKFLTAIVFLIFTGAGFAQCINVQTTAIKGNCYSDNQIKVTAQDMSPYPSICLPSSGKFIVEIQGEGKDGEMFRMKRPSPSAPAEYTFYNLKVGKYKIIVRDEDTGAFDEREVDAESNYKVMNIQSLETLAPTCGQKNNGGVRFKIPNGGIGPFDVTILDASGHNVLLPTQRFVRPSGNGYIEIRGTNSHSIKTNATIMLQVKDITSIGEKCGETRRYPSIVIPIEQYTVECINIKMYDRYMGMHKDNCGKYNGRFRIVRVEDGNWINKNILDATALKSYFSKPGTAIVRFLNSSKPQIDISSTFDIYGYYVRDYIFEKGDEVEITIKGPNNTIVEKVRFNEQIDPLSCPSYKMLTTSNYSYNRNCGLDKRLYIYYSITNYQYRSMPNLDGGTYSYQLGWTHPQNISYFTLEKSNSASGPWTPVPMVTTAPGAGQAHWTNSYVYLDKVGEGFYRLTYKNPNNCHGQCSDIREVKYPISSTQDINKIWDNIETGYGIYEGTGAFRVNYSINNFAYPLKFKLEAADGSKTLSYEGKISFFNRGTRTITFPLEITTTGSGYNYTNLPEGNYKVTVTDACGITTDKIIYVPGMPAYKPELKYEKDCEIAKIIYNIGNQIYKDPYIYVYLEQEVEDAYGNKTWKEIKQPSGLSYVRNHTGEFVNLLTSKYRIKTTAFYYNAFLRQKSGTMYQTSATDPTVPNSSNYLYKEITIPDLVKLNPVVNPVACQQGSATGMIAVDVTGQEVYFPLTFRLYKKATVTATTSTLLETKKYEASDNKYYHIFEGLNTGYYLVEVEHRCQTVPKDIDIDLSNAFNPFLVIDRPVPFCTGNRARVKLGLSDHIFDINWFKLDANGDKTTTYPLGTGSSFWENIYTTTTYMAEYTLKTGIGCSNKTTYTKTATVVLPPIDEPPFIKTPCPNNIEVTVDVGECGKAVRWREPEAYPTCLGAVTTTRSHAPGYVFPIGVHTVVYTFADTRGNTSSCSFTVTVKSNALKLKTSQRYVDTSGNLITQLTPNQAFFYELNYENVGSESIKQAVISVKLPQNATVITNGEPDLNSAGDGSSANPYPQKSYNAVNKAYEFVIGGTSGYPESTLKLGDPSRTIRIPMKVQGDCDKLLQPCANYLQTEFTITYQGGPAACPIAQQVDTGVSSITIDTSNCNRQETLCGTGIMTFEATGNFATYQWYKNGGILTGEIHRTYQANGPGVYKVVKTNSCQGVQVETTETINYEAPSNTTDPIRAQAQNVGVTCPDNSVWTSHFYLCQGGSKNITVSYQNTAFEWQQWNGSCTESSSDCRNSEDQCWTTLHNNRTFVANTAGKYRLRLPDCSQSFYFEVFTAGLTGSLTDEIHETDFTQGSVKLQLSTAGVTYKVEIFKGGAPFRTEVINTNDYRINNLSQGTYDIKVTSPQIPGCQYNGQVTINKTSQMKVTATFKGFTSCNKAKFELKAEGGAPTYRFYIWTIDGQQQYTDIPTALAAPHIAIQLAHQPSVEVEVANITRVGEYVFLVGDTRNGAFALSNKVIVDPPSPHTFTFSATQEIQCESIPNSGVINLTFAPGTQNQNRTINLYKLDDTGARIGAPFKTSSGGLFTGIPAGTYEIEMLSQVAGTTCTYIKKPVVILPPQAPLRAYAGVVADRSCDTTNNQYKVSVNNVIGGTPPYRYSFDGENTYVTNPIGFIGGSSTIYVKDSKDCRIEIPITTQATVVPTIVLSPVFYSCDSGYGSVTVTVSSTVSQTYQYSLDGSAKQTLVGNSFNRLLSPGVHTLTVYYRPTDTATTPNVLFTEDFGKDANDCLPVANTSLVCNTTGSLSDGNQVLTKQVQVTSNPNWLATAPIDPSGGRYLAVAGNGNNEVVYQKLLKGVAPNTEFTVSLDALNLIRTGVTAIPAHLNVEIAKTDGTTLRSKSLATINSNNWTNYKVTFTETEMTGFANGELLLKVVNTAAATYGGLGNDFAVDNLKVSQAITYCDLKVTQLINIEKNKQMRAEKFGTEKNVSCIGAQDGEVRIRVINPTSTNILYSVERTYTTTTTWTPTTLDAQGVFIVTGLEANQNGVVSIRDANNANCAVSVAYKVGEPTPIVPTVVFMDKVTCYNGGVAKIKVSATGGNAGGYQYRVGLVSGTLGALQPVAPQVNPWEISNLAPGTYTLVVQDSKGCTTETTFEIVNKATLSVTAEPTSYCYGDAQEKKVEITIISGNGNYKVQRVGGNIYAFNTSIFEYPDALDAGTHTFVVTDGFGCQTTVTTQIYAPLSLTVSPTQTQYADCKGSSVNYTLTASGGIPTALKEFKYSVDGGATFHTIGSSTSQVTFTYPVTVATTTEFRFQVTYKPDGSECKREQYVTLAYDPPRFLTNTFTTTQATCGNNNGSVIITPSDYYVGTASHTLKVVNTLGVTQTPTALAPGNYIAHLTDDRGCVATQAFTITAAPQLTATATVSKQMGCTSSAADLAAITVTLNTGGRAPFDILLRNTTSGAQVSETSQLNNVSKVFAGLDYGNYEITITDANSCQTRMNVVILPNSNVMSITPVTPTACATTGEVRITATSSPTFTASTNAYFAIYRPGIQNPPAGSGANIEITTNPNGGTDVWHKGVALGTGVGVTIGGLTPGVQYTFIAYNMVTKCRYTQQMTVPVPTYSQMSVAIDVKNVSCATGSDGTFTFTLTNPHGSTTHIGYEVYREDNHQPIAGAVGTVSAPFTTPQVANGNLPAGKYYVKFTETIGGVASCVTSKNFEIKRSLTQLQIAAVASKKASCNTLGEAWLNITGGTATYTYGYVASGTAYSAAVMTRTVQTSSYINIPAGNWDVYVRDAYGCLQSTTVTIDIFDTPNIATVTTLACQAYHNTNGRIPVRVTLNKIGQGNHYYSLDGAADRPVVWTIANQAFELEVTPLATHTVAVKDVNACVTTATFSTTALITATATISRNKTCATPTADITVTVAGGTGTYSYTLERLDNGIVAGAIISQDVAFPTPTGGVITIATPTTEAATYRISIYDAETVDCPIVKEVIVRDPDPINLANVVVQPYHEKCNLGLTATGTGSIDIAMPTDSDTYTFKITSAIDITTGNNVTVTTTPTIVGTHTATFTQLRGTTQGVKYQITITNSTGCEAYVETIITSPEPLELQVGVISATEYVCEGTNGLSTPKVSVDTTKIRGGIPPYTIEFFDNGGNSLGNGTEYTLPNLNGGTFYATVKDASGTCATSTTSVTVAPAFELQTLSITTTTSATCVVDEVINISVTATPTYIAGTPLRYVIKGTDNAFATITTTTATSLSLTLTGSQNLAGSNYTIEVFNEKTGCSITGVYTVKDANTFEMTSHNPVRAVCHNDNGSIAITLVDKDLSNGDQSTAGFTYTVTAVSGGATTTGTVLGNTTTLTLVGGSYDIEAISNATGCKVAKHRFVIPSNPAEIKVIYVSQKVSVDCNNENGVVALTVIGGQQVYTVTLTDPVTGNVYTKSDIPEGSPGVEITQVKAGNYNITVIDALGCTTATGTLSVTVAPYNAINTASITVATTSITCIDAKDGTLKVSGVAGGAPPYHYMLIRISATGSDLPEIATTDSEVTFKGIEPGTYRVDIYDAQNCSVTVSGSYTFVNPSPITADINTLNSTFVTCKGSDSGKVEITNITGGTPTYTLTIIRADNGQKVTPEVETTGTSHTFNDLGPSPKDSYYQVVIKDSHDCTMTKTLTFTVEELPDVSINEFKYYGTCQANSNSYVDYLEVHFNNPSPDYSKITYSLNGGASATFTRTVGNIAYIDNFNRASVTQTVEVTYTVVSSIPGMTGSCSASETITIDPYTPLTVTRVTTNTTLNTLEVLAQGGRTNNFRGYTYYFNEVSKGDNPVYKVNHNDPEKEIGGRRYKVVNVRVEDAEGCTVTATYEVEYFDIEIPNYFTPNGDGENEVWKPKYLDNNVNARIYIFDRYGRRLVVLESGQGWDGTYEKRPMPSGDYWYIIEINDQLYDKREFYGNFTLFR
ncbi:T9SS type B sorting domain-containing protein [Capnocytophaga sputigena]|uniref:T9SS type B sorting domain-containing protein n=2 Tax=Capnocytophaga sputigena TaxID=1019 RepID=UPI000BB188E3|nr:T9SS type B sorting domain-containing protein [Capnocytophaga sputigena]ATA69931.1 hyalin [Capnocytophaga sputigena]VEI53045.1 gliding motility-associated C-terminal domain [Capnocytophaga sputigena]